MTPEEEVVAVAVALGDSVPAPHGSTVHVGQLFDTKAGEEELAVVVANSEAAVAQHLAATAISHLIHRATSDDARRVAIQAYSHLGGWETLGEHAAREAGLLASAVTLTVQTGVRGSDGEANWDDILWTTEGGAVAGSTVHVAGWRSEYDSTLAYIIGAYGDVATAEAAAADAVILSLMSANSGPWEKSAELPFASPAELTEVYVSARTYVEREGLQAVVDWVQRAGVPALPSGAYLSLDVYRVEGPLTLAGEDPTPSDIADVLVGLTGLER